MLQESQLKMRFFVVKSSISLTITTVAFVTRAQKECFEVTSCLECLSLSQCEAWTDATGGRCLEGCGSNAQVDCYSSRFFPNLDDEEICQLADTAVANAQVCGSQTNCGDCIGTAISDGTTCLWFREDSECKSVCADNDSECSEQMTCPIVNCNDFETCIDCLQTPECRGWAPSAVGCLESCDMIADVRCYTSMADESTISETCQAADDNEADAELCSGKMNCDECVGTTLSDGNTTCQWFNDGSYCASGCDMAGCGETECQAEGTDDDGECKGLDCQDCLGTTTTTMCSWAPDVGCISSCTEIADTACFSSGDSNATDVCSANETIPMTSAAGTIPLFCTLFVLALIGIAIV